MMLLLMLASLIGAGVWLLNAVIGPQGRDRDDQWNRWSWFWIGGGFLVASHLPHPGAALLLAIVTIGCLPITPRSMAVQQVLIPAIAVSSLYAYAATWSHGQTALVWLLGVLVVMGMVIGVWSWMSVHHKEERWQWHLLGPWWMYDESRICPRAGQGNANHAQAVVALSCAAAIGLWHLGFTLVLVAVPLLICPLVYCRDRRESWISQGPVAVYVLLIGWGMVLLREGWGVAVVLLPLGGLVLPFMIYLLQRHRWSARADSYRLAMWYGVLRDQWGAAHWIIHWLGFGATSWRQLTPQYTIPRFQRVVFTTAHNEYVEMLFQHGIIGLVALLYFLGDNLWRAWHGGPTGEAVFLLGWTLCAIAFFNFPWTWYHECQQNKPYAYTVTAWEPEKGMLIRVCERAAETIAIAETLTASAMQPVMMGWYHQIGAQPFDPAQLKEFPEGPFFAGSPSLCAISLCIAILHSWVW